MSVVSTKMMQAAAAGAGGGIPWDISTAVYNGSPVNWLSVFLQDNIPQDLFFKPDGLKMYVVGDQTDSVIEYDLSTAWDLSTASYLQSFSVAAQETSLRGIFFKSDGTKMYVVGLISDSVLEYDLSTAWDVSTASYLQSFYVYSQESNVQAVFFKPDGTKMYTAGASGADNVNEYNLSTAWDVSTASYLQNFSVSSQDGTPSGLSFKSDGTKMYVLGYSNDNVYEYDLSTAWDVSSASYLQSFSVAAQDGVSTGVFFKPDGTDMYITGSTTDSVYQYNLSTAWNLSTATWSEPTSNYYSVAAQDIGPDGLFFRTDGLKMYLSGSVGDNVYEYDLSTAWDVSTASYVQNFSVAAQDTLPSDLFFKTDGTKMYVLGSANDSVLEYNLSTAWDVSSASYLQSFSVAAQDTSPYGLSFKPDGTKMYVIGYFTDSVHEYDLSTAWDISTASYLQSFIVAAQETLPISLFLKPDGTKMYVVGLDGRAVNEYDLSTAWDVSTASYVQNFSVAAKGGAPRTVSFKSDGRKMYIVDTTNDAIISYDL